MKAERRETTKKRRGRVQPGKGIAFPYENDINKSPARKIRNARSIAPQAACFALQEERRHKMFVMHAFRGKADGSAIYARAEALSSKGIVMQRSSKIAGPQ